MTLSTGYLVSVELKRNGGQWNVIAAYNSDRETRKRARSALSFVRALQIAAEFPPSIEMEPV